MLCATSGNAVGFGWPPIAPVTVALVMFSKASTSITSGTSNTAAPMEEMDPWAFNATDCSRRNSNAVRLSTSAPTAPGDGLLIVSRPDGAGPTIVVTVLAGHGIGP